MDSEWDGRITRQATLAIMTDECRRISQLISKRIDVRPVDGGSRLPTEIAPSHCDFDAIALQKKPPQFSAAVFVNRSNECAFSSGSDSACMGLPLARRDKRPAWLLARSASRRFSRGAGGRLPRRASWAGHGRRVCRCLCSSRGRAGFFRESSGFLKWVGEKRVEWRRAEGAG